jgi:hypothetical protein
MNDPNQPQVGKRSFTQDAAWSEELETGGDGRTPKPPEKRKRSFSIEASDFVAVGVIILAIGAVLVAVIVALGMVFGKLPAKDGKDIILGCVGGAAISGVVAALFGRKSKAKRKAS